LLSPYQSIPATSLILLGIFSPGFVALFLTALRGKDRVVDLLSSLFVWRLGILWYLFAVGFIVAVKLGAAGSYWLIEGVLPLRGPSPVLLLMATLGSTVSGGQVGEELGWRGYALPRLVQRWGWGRASMVLGVIWAVWHVPLFYMPGADTYGQSFPLYAIQVTGLSVAIAWLFGRVGGSLLLPMLMHASFNNLTNVVPGVARIAMNPWMPQAALFGWLTAGAIWVGAGACLLDMRTWERARAAGSGTES
jgi:membrane protease YdiL (CAAX protease family)